MTTQNDEALEQMVSMAKDLAEPVHIDELTEVIYLSLTGGYIVRRKNEGMTNLSDCLFIDFQKGPVSDGVNGITNESLLAICLHRLHKLNQGEWACEENAKAVECIQAALVALEARIERRNRESSI